MAAETRGPRGYNSRDPEIAELRATIERLTKERDEARRPPGKSQGNVMSDDYELIFPEPERRTIGKVIPVEELKALHTTIERLTKELDDANSETDQMRRERGQYCLAMQRAEAELATAREALTAIAHTFTEDSHGNMKTLSATEYQAIARAALPATPEPQPLGHCQCSEPNVLCDHTGCHCTVCGGPA
jgi:outer membrane murein-binding lipoprotein Lpp